MNWGNTENPEPWIIEATNWGHQSEENPIGRKDKIAKDFTDCKLMIMIKIAGDKVAGEGLQWLQIDNDLGNKWEIAMIAG